MAGRANDARGVAERLFAILDAFEGPGRRSLPLTELARRAGLPLSTPSRVAARVVEWGGLERTADGELQVGLRLWRLGTRHPAPGALRQVARPYLDDLFELTRQNVQIAVLDGLAALYLDRLTARDSVVVLADVGRRLPLHATGVGLVLLAWGGEELLARVLEAPPRRLLPATMTTAEELAPRLARIRREGIATTRDEMTAGAASVAAPIRDASGAVVAAISIIVPSERPVDPRYELAVRLAASGVSRELARHA